MRLTKHIIITLFITALVFATNFSPIFSQNREHSIAHAATIDTPTYNFSDYLKDKRETLNLELLKFQERTHETIHAGITTDTLTMLMQTVQTNETNLTAIFEKEKRFVLLRNTQNLKLYSSWTEQVDKEAAERLTELSTSVTAWEIELNAEKARIEEARIAAEAEAEAEAEKARQEAARVATESSNSASTNNSYTPTENNNNYQPESDYERVNRIASALPFYVAPIIIIDGCSENNTQILGCYTYGDSIIITPYGMTKEDCGISKIIAHEMRHYQQNQEGLIIYNSPEDNNLEWVEADAYAYAAAYGC